MTDRELTQDEARLIRFLRRLVTGLTVAMLLGVLAIVGLLALRLTQAPPTIPLPAAIVLPEGAQAVSVTYGSGWYIVVTDAGEALVFGADGALRQTVMLDLEGAPAP